MKSPSCALKPLIDYYDCQRPVDWPEMFNRKGPLVVEIGFGMGEVLLGNASQHPQTNYLGIEQHWERIYKTLKAVDRARLTEDNIRILGLDARVALEHFFEEKSIDHVYCLFPCPWPKKSHIKHRLFSEPFLKLLNSRLKDRAEVYLVTDCFPYYEWVQEETDRGLFAVRTSSTKPRFDTKFERKWVGEGQSQFFELILTKEKHYSCAPKKELEMKNYALKNFSPDQFQFTDMRGDISVILKEMFYDAQQKHCLLRLMVSEQHLMQNFWVTIKWKNDSWRIYKTEGQKFFPTPGIVRALAEVYQQTKSAMAVS